jgi:hypothetical protein
MEGTFWRRPGDSIGTSWVTSADPMFANVGSADFHVQNPAAVAYGAYAR